MDNIWTYAIVLLMIFFVVLYSIVKYREASRNTIEEDIRNLKYRGKHSQDSRVSQLNSDERYKTNKPKNEIYSEQDYKRMTTNIKSMYKQGIISENEYKDQLSKIKEGSF